MTGITYELDTAEAIAGLRHLSAFDIADLAYNVGALLESSTRRRIDEEKTAPDGAAWAPWSPGYAATRSGRHSLLVGDNSLAGSIQNLSDDQAAIVGTNMVYGAIHQFGGEAGRNHAAEIPARPYLGISERDRRDIERLVEGELKELLA